MSWKGLVGEALGMAFVAASIGYVTDIKYGIAAYVMYIGIAIIANAMVNFES